MTEWYALIGLLNCLLVGFLVIWIRHRILMRREDRRFWESVDRMMNHHEQRFQEGLKKGLHEVTQELKRKGVFPPKQGGESEQ